MHNSQSSQPASNSSTNAIQASQGEEELFTTDEPSPLSSNDPVERFTVPRLNGLSGIQVVGAALARCIDHRSGVVTTGPFGFGKSEGAHAACATHAEEQRGKARQSPRHRRTRVRYIHLETARTEQQFLFDLLQEASPGQAVRQRLVGGKRKDEGDLRRELYRVYRAQNVVAVVIDDAQRLTDAALKAARDLIAEKEKDPHRSVVGQTGNAETPAVGIGILLIGTPELESRLIKTGETHGNGRWSFVNQVEPLAEAQLPLIYEALFPAFRSHIDAVGREVWTNFIYRSVSIGRALPIRAVTTHAREYFARMYDRSRGAVSERATTPFDQAVFLDTLRAALWEAASARQAPLTDVTVRETPRPAPAGRE